MNRATTRAKGLVWAACSGLLAYASACQDDLPKASQIERMRVLGGTTTVVGDETRTTPKPGETATLTWSVVFPDPTIDQSQLASIFIVCTAPGQFSGTPVCQELLDIAAGGSPREFATLLSRDRPDCAKKPDGVTNVGSIGVVCVTDTPKLEIPISSDFKAKARLVQGAICRNGVPRLDNRDPTGVSCDWRADSKPEEREVIAVYGTVPVQYTEDDRNRLPNLDAASFFFHDPPLPWSALTPETAAILNDETCWDETQAGRVTHTEGHEELITLRYDASQREVYADGEVEGLQFSAYTSFGELSRRFSVFRSDTEPPLERSFTWTLSEEQRAELNKRSKRVRFYFSVMDDRGGFAVTARDVCVNRR